MRVLNEVIVLGRAFPQELRDGRISCCTAGWSKELGFIRIYPTYWLSKKLNTWNIINVNVEDDGGDWRKESYKIVGSKEIENIDSQIEVKGMLSREDKIKLLTELGKSCPVALNGLKKSLGIVKPFITKAYYAKNKKGDNILRVKYLCDRCFVQRGYHDAQILEWGVYEFLRKNPNRENEAIDNLHLLDNDWEKYFLIGNGYRTPRSFMIISILRYKKEALQN
jgi:hypothetical protein